MMSIYPENDYRIYLEHSFKNHKYISKKIGKNGKWVYLYEKKKSAFHNKKYNRQTAEARLMKLQADNALHQKAADEAWNLYVNETDPDKKKKRGDDLLNIAQETSKIQKDMDRLDKLLKKSLKKVQTKDR